MKALNKLFLIQIIFTILFQSCATSLNKEEVSVIPKSLLQKSVDTTYDYTEVKNSRAIREKLRKLEKIIQRKNKLSPSDWKLHDELLDTYILLKQITTHKINIPAKSKMIFPVETYCLDSGKSSPDSKEIYRWQKSDPGIPYYSKILDLRRKGEISQKDTQSLLWSLDNKTYWENYPIKLKSILQKIDPHAPLYLPSKLKNKAVGLLKNTLLDFPGVSEIEDIYQLVRGKYYEFDEYRKLIENLTSKYSLNSYDDLEEIPGTGLYSQSKSLGFTSQKLIVYNPTEIDREIDLTQYYLSPKRSDVQRIGINPFVIEDPNLVTDLENVLYKDMARVGIGFIPGVNDIADLYELLTGKDFLTGNQLDPTGRILSGVGVIIGSGATYRYARKAIHSPLAYLDDFTKGLKEITKKSVILSQDILSQGKILLAKSKRIVDSARKLAAKTKDKVMSFANSFRNNPKALDKIDDITENITKSKAFKSAIDDVPTNKALFYVRESGEAIPSTSYKYIDSKSPDLQKILSDGHMPDRTSSKPHYGSFNKYNNAEDAMDGLQLAKKPDGTPWNNARYRVEFDTLQHIDEIKVPRGKWGDADYLEPLTKDYPEFGQGGATQIIFEGKTKIKEVIDLHTGNIIFPKK